MVFVHRTLIRWHTEELWIRSQLKRRAGGVVRFMLVFNTCSSMAHVRNPSFQNMPWRDGGSSLQSWRSRLVQASCRLSAHTPIGVKSGPLLCQFSGWWNTKVMVIFILTHSMQQMAFPSCIKCMRYQVTEWADRDLWDCLLQRVQIYTMALCRSLRLRLIYQFMEWSLSSLRLRHTGTVSQTQQQKLLDRVAAHTRPFSNS